MLNVCVTALASSPKLSDAHETKSDELKATPKDCHGPRRYTNPFLSDEENDKLNFWNNPELEHSIIEDHFTTNLKDEKFMKSLALPNIPSESFKKAKEYCELIACYDKNGFHVVKDIRVDEGLPRESFCDPVNGDKNNDMIDDYLGTHEKLRPLPLEEDCFVNTDLRFVRSSSEDCYANSELSLGTHEKSDIDLLDPVQNGLNSQENDCEKDATEESDTLPKVGSSSVIPNELKNVSMQTGAGKLDSSSEANNGVNEIKPATISDHRGTDDPEFCHKLSLDAQIAPNNQDAASSNVTIAKQLQRGEGESSFSVVGPVSGLITYSGPMASSGSVSIRSDSSATSIRSFAFPVLQTEWNSSPVRMVKAERRRPQKHLGWRKVLLCCRF